jgi:hypothetical protein
MPDIVELVNLPQRNGIVKMIQLLLGERKDRKLIVFGSTYIDAGDEGLDETHSMILKGYLDSKKIAWQPEYPSDPFSYPNRRGVDYALSGAGKAEIAYDTRTITLFGRSLGYQVKVDGRRYAGFETDPPGWNIVER